MAHTAYNQTFAESLKPKDYRTALADFARQLHDLNLVEEHVTFDHVTEYERRLWFAVACASRLGIPISISAEEEQFTIVFKIRLIWAGSATVSFPITFPTTSETERDYKENPVLETFYNERYLGCIPEETQTDLPIWATKFLENRVLDRIEELPERFFDQIIQNVLRKPDLTYLRDRVDDGRVLFDEIGYQYQTVEAYADQYLRLLLRNFFESPETSAEPPETHHEWFEEALTENLIEYSEMFRQQDED